LSRLSEGPTFTYLTQPDRLKRFYDALRGKITTPGPARPVFRSSTDLILLTTSLRIEENGTPHIPGNLEIWRTLFLKHPHGKYDGKLTRSANTWRNNDDLLEALFALCRKAADNEPLHIFLALNDVDRGRAKPLSPTFAAHLINAYRSYGAQYRIFADSPELSEGSMQAYLDICTQLSSGRDSLARADVAGTVQALVELWTILSRQGSIPESARDASFEKIVRPFEDAKQEADIFSAGRSGVQTLLGAVRGKPEGSLHEQLIALLTGPVRGNDESMPPSPASTFLRVFDAQDLIPVDTLFNIADHAAKGNIDGRTAKFVNERLERLEEVQEVHGSLSRDERSTLALGYWSERHVENELKFSLDTLTKNAERKDPRAALAPFLRDTLVGMLYCYYAPAGAQVLLTNPNFVRTHDFVGPESSPEYWRNTEVSGLGWPTSSGGKLTGSLISLPYALAQAEQNFLSPRREQALIWADLVPQLIINVTVTRWRNIAPEQVRWVALHLRRGRYLVAAAALNPAIEASVEESLGRFLAPGQVERFEERLRSDSPNRALNQLPPSYLYALASDPKLASISPDVTTPEIREMAGSGNALLSDAAISRTFGTPKPTLTHSYRPALLYLRTFPALMGYSSRILAESWESNNLYYASLADEAGVPADELDSYVPEWNRSSIENIFATHLEDWPAIIRSLHATSDYVLHKNATPNSQRAALLTTGN
ncbi:MAG: hypothetical protein JO061_12800, partial [Acidobacteriaceae bacterium]|nr:hypothetical protein [Acidobacteriaceae bacterium]